MTPLIHYAYNRYLKAFYKSPCYHNLSYGRNEAMEAQNMKRAFLSHEGLIFTVMFTLIFILTNLLMIDYKGLQSLITNMDPFTILILGGILAYLYKNTKITFTRNKNRFLIVWGLYVTSVFASMLIAGHFVWTEAFIWIMLTVMFLYKMPIEHYMF